MSGKLTVANLVEIVFVKLKNTNEHGVICDKI